MTARLLEVGKFVVGTALRIVWVSAMVLTPLFGFWLASSLAAYRNASPLTALLLGLALFPVAPVTWELFAAWRRRRHPATKAVLTGLDRLVLRTLVLSGLFLAVTLWRAPQTSFRALAVRGDWILDGEHGAAAERARAALLALADRFERAWHARDHHFGKSDHRAPRPPAPGDGSQPSSEDPSTTQPRPATTAGTSPASAWPYPAEADPLLTHLPAEAEASPATVGAYLQARLPDPMQRAKAVHDYVVLRMTYDQAALAATLRGDLGQRPSQEAEAVFAAKRGVCEGYARLTAAIGQGAGLEVAYVTGYIRDATRRIAAETNVNTSDEAIRAALEGYAHAWNAVKLEGQWRLMDTTWDDPISDSGEQTLTSTYFLTPPRYFAYDHLPEDEAWQLMASPMTLGDFVRQPLLSPVAGALGLTLVSPTRSQISVAAAAEIVVDNPHHLDLTATVRAIGATGSPQPCEAPVSTGARTKLTCAIARGEFEVQLFATPGEVAAAALEHAAAGERLVTEYQYVGSILANRR
jgi:hypothetical protein